jgi:UPF0716 protein FxsA
MVAIFRSLLILWPLAEILLLVLVADQIGVGWTLLALAGAAVAGMLIIRVLGAASLTELRHALERREPPAGALFRGACVLLAGLLLILPGFLSDIMALLLLMPPLRAAMLGPFWRRWPGRQPPARAGASGMTIDGEYHELRTGPPPPADGSRSLDDKSGDDKSSRQP